MPCLPRRAYTAKQSRIAMRDRKILCPGKGISLILFILLHHKYLFVYFKRQFSRLLIIKCRGYAATCRHGMYCFILSAFQPPLQHFSCPEIAEYLCFFLILSFFTDIQPVHRSIPKRIHKTQLKTLEQHVIFKRITVLSAREFCHFVSDDY